MGIFVVERGSAVGGARVRSCERGICSSRAHRVRLADATDRGGDDDPETIESLSLSVPAGRPSSGNLSLVASGLKRRQRGGLEWPDNACSPA
jgi:hypothetical protein